MAKVPLAAGALALVILLMTIGDVASAQTSTANIVVANTVQSVLSPSAVHTSKASPRHVVDIPKKPALRSPYQPASWTPGPPPWAPGKPAWAPGPPPWASKDLHKAVAPKWVKTKP